MAYLDLISDAKIILSYDNTYNYILNGSHPDANIQLTSTTGTPVFIQDAPAGLGFTHSFRVNGYSTVPGVWTFRTLEQLGGTSNDIRGRTVSAWVKFATNTNPVAGSNLGGAITIFSDRANSSGTNGYLRVNMGTHNTSPAGGADRFLQYQNSEVILSTSTLANSSLFSNRKLNADEWHHIALTIRELPNEDLIERALYLNGSCISYSFVAGRAAQNIQWGYYSPLVDALQGASPLTNTNESIYTKLVSCTAFWDRPLTIDEIRAQAWYNHQNEDYQSLVLAKNPTYYATFDNPDKTTDHTVLGTATSWGPLSDDQSSFFVNETGPANRKAWRMISSSTALNNYTNNTDAEMVSELATLQRSGEFSFEFWFKQSDNPTAVKTIFQTNSTNNLNGWMQIQLLTSGAVDYRGAYKSGATTAIVGSVGGSASIIQTPSSSTANSNLLVLHPGGTNRKNWMDNKWHHVVYTHSNTDAFKGTAGQFIGNLYVDGAKIDERNWTNTYGWLDGTAAFTGFQLGNNANSTTLGDTSIAELAFYPRRLNESEVVQNFIAGLDYVTEYGAVKYYDGTAWQTSSAAKVWDGSAWIDWVKKYYDGTQWVNL
jgi:hypothetical protein